MATKKKKKTAATTKKTAPKRRKKVEKKKSKGASTAKAKTAQKKASKPAKKSAQKVAKKSTAKKSATKSSPQKAAKKAPAKRGAARKGAAKKGAKKTAATTPATATLVQHVFVAATPAQVFRALTDPTEHGAFTGTVVTGLPVEGGTFTASSGYIQGTFEKLEQDKLIVQSWRTTEWPHGAGASRLEIALEDAGDGTELTMTHSEVPTSQAESYRQGWIDYYWTPLRAHFSSKG